MLASSRNLIVLLVAMLALTGCRTSWPFASPETTVAESITATQPPTGSPSPAPPAKPTLEESQASFTTPTPPRAITSAVSNSVLEPEPTAEQAFAKVLGDIQELGRTDPAAQQQLLKQLQAAKPGHYSLVVQQFMAAYAYSHELRERSRAETLPPVEALPRGKIEQVETTAPADDARPRLLPEPMSQLDDPRIKQPRPQELSSSSADSPLRGIDPRQAAPIEPTVEPIESPSARSHAVTLAVHEQDGDPTQPKVTPASVAAPVSNETWEQSLSRAIDGLAVTTREQPQSTGDLNQRLRMRMLELAAGRQEAALAPVDGLSVGEQDYWSKQFFALTTLLDYQSQPDEKRRAAAARVHLAEAADKLGELCPLTVRNLAFCSQIHGYGAYEPLTDTAFKPGQRLTIYAEVDNYRSLSTPQGYHTALATSYQILDAAGNRVDGNEFPTIDDYCLRQRRDFYTQYGITLPTRLTPGKYQLQLTIKDHHANKLGHTTAEFEIGSK